MFRVVKQMVKQSMLSGTVACAVFTAASSMAVAEAVSAVEIVSPYTLVEEVTAEVLAKIDSHRAQINDVQTETEKAERLNCFFDDVDRTLARVIDFSWIARNVMGPYGRSATDEQRKAFATTFRQGLVETYGRGLLSYSGQQIVVLPGPRDYADKRKVMVRQEVRGADGNYPLEYTMGLNKDGQWRIINVILNGINLGKTFRNQFVQASQKNGGNIDEVIASWGSPSI